MFEIFLGGACVTVINSHDLYRRPDYMTTVILSDSFFSVWEADFTYISLHFTSAIVKVSLGIAKKNLNYNLRGTNKWPFQEHC